MVRWIEGLHTHGGWIVQLFCRLAGTRGLLSGLSREVVKAGQVFGPPRRKKLLACGGEFVYSVFYFLFRRMTCFFPLEPFLAALRGARSLQAQGAAPGERRSPLGQNLPVL